LIRIDRDFDLLEIETPSIHMDWGRTEQALNGLWGDCIWHHRGLRQGDPLSPILFILVMDILNLMVQRASEEGLLQPLSARTMQHRISLYADDVVVFLRPVASDINVVLDILNLFGSASGPSTNIQKSSVFPIHCGEELNCIQELLLCTFSDYPCKYLGLPLSTKKLTRNQIQSIVDQVAALLPGWKAELMSRARMAIYVQFVMSAKMVYACTALEIPSWAIKAVDKLRKGFL
jgi:hypothetical protein